MYKAAILLAIFGAASAGVAQVGYSTLAAPAYTQQLVRAAPVAYAQPIVRAAPVAYAQPLVKAVAAEPFDPNPQYNYGYSVSDALTGDSKTATETRNGDLVQGQYSLVEPDGSIRTVTYTADAINGFNAVVDRTPAVTKAVVAAPVVKTVAPVAYAQPIVRAAPIAYSQPIVRAAPVAYAQPIVRAAPIGYAQPLIQKAISPVYAKVASQAVVSTSFGSPLVSYAY